MWGVSSLTQKVEDMASSHKKTLRVGLQLNSRFSPLKKPNATSFSHFLPYSVYIDTNMYVTHTHHIVLRHVSDLCVRFSTFFPPPIYSASTHSINPCSFELNCSIESKKISLIHSTNA